MLQEQTEHLFALCLENRDCEDLEKRKIYQILPDDVAAREGYLRVVDESGEDYLYPESYFILVELPSTAQAVFADGDKLVSVQRRQITRFDCSRSRLFQQAKS